MEPTITLLSALFSSFAGTSLGELLRFARRFAGERVAFALEKEKSESEKMVLLARSLEESGRLNDEFFDALLRLRPEASDVIEKAREDWRGRSSASPADASEEAGPEPKGHVRSESAARDPWLLEMDRLLDEAVGRPAGPSQVHLEAVAFWPSFDPKSLNKIGGSSRDSDDLIHLASVAEPRSDGRWVLTLPQRRKTIGRIVSEGRLKQALEHCRRADDQHPDNAAYRELLRRIAAHEWLELTADTPQPILLAARDIASWFAGSQLEPIPADKVATILEAREKIEPLRQLVGTHFRGRVGELETLRAHAYGPSGRQVLALTGIGGVGKSALLGRHILDLLKKSPRPPWVYLDFDRSEVDPASPRKLIELIARNLGLLYIGLDQSESFHALESASAGDSFVEFSALPVGPGAPDDELLAALRDRLWQQAPGESLLVVFDTFEQVMVRGPAIVSAFADFLKALLKALPGTQAIISGRGSISVPGVEMHPLHLTDLDPEAADAVLEARGVEDPELRAAVIAKMGCSPLVLRLASEALRCGKLEPTDLLHFDAQSRALRLQGLLYTRVLGHIGDREVERLAHPGLVVRRVTEAIIRDVLADVCKIKKEHSASLFSRLPNHVALFEPDPDTPAGAPRALRHRQDLREAVLELMVTDPRWTHRLRTIHRRAIDHYRDQDSPLARAEELYHRLMLDSDPEELDPLWSEELGPSLARSSAEPMPPRAANWLGLRLGLVQGGPAGELRLVDWEVRAARLARDYLQSGDVEGALRVVNERRERSPVSPVAIAEVDALRLAGRLEEALSVGDEALRRADETASPYRLGLLLRVAEIALQRDMPDRAAHYAHEAQALAQSLADASSLLRALELLVRADPQDAPVEELERVFVDSPERRLRRDVDVAKRVVGTLGASSPRAMRKAADTFGNLANQSLLSRDPRAWSAYFSRVTDRKDGDRVLGLLATRVGLPSDRVEPMQLATTILRHNREGEALSTVLENYGHDESIRSGSLAMFSGAAP